MKKMLAVGCALVLASCAAGPVVPSMRPLTPAYVEAAGPTKVVLAENNDGVQKSWFYTSTAEAGAAYGLIGALVSATMDAIINAGPSRRAQKAADEMAEVATVDKLNASLAEQLRLQIPAPDAQPTGLSVSDVNVVQRLDAKDTLDDVVQLTVSYVLAEDASTLRVVAKATYQNVKTPYASPYVTTGTVPKAELGGPAYRNTFTYYSAQLPVPTLSADLKDRLVASIQDAARDANGALPADGTPEFKSMTKELENARDDKLSKDEIAIFLTREWLRDGGSLLHTEIDRAHAFIARYLVADLNRTTAPSTTGQHELIETMADGRTVRRLGEGVTAGSYECSAPNVASFSTYGNTQSTAKVNQERVTKLKAAARSASR